MGNSMMALLFTFSLASVALFPQTETFLNIRGKEAIKVYKATKKGLELVCEDRVRIGTSKTGYLIKDHLWLWDDENNMLVVVIRRNDHKVLFKSKYVRLAEKELGITLDDAIKLLLEKTNI